MIPFKQVLSKCLIFSLLISSFNSLTFASTHANTSKSNQLHLTPSLSETTTSSQLIISPTIYEDDLVKIATKIFPCDDSSIHTQFELTNKSEEVIHNWHLSFTFPHDIKEIWNAELIDQINDVYILKNATYNQDLLPNETLTIGFITSGTSSIDSPTDFKFVNKSTTLNKDNYSVTYKTLDDWTSGFNGQLTLSNLSDSPIEDWTLEFDFEGTINSFWNAVLESNKDGHWIIKNANYNGTLAPYQQITIGFNGVRNSSLQEPNNFILHHVTYDEPEVTKPLKVNLTASPTTTLVGVNTVLNFSVDTNLPVSTFTLKQLYSDNTYTLVDSGDLSLGDDIAFDGSYHTRFDSVYENAQTLYFQAFAELDGAPVESNIIEFKVINTLSVDDIQQMIAMFTAANTLYAQINTTLKFEECRTIMYAFFQDYEKENYINSLWMNEKMITFTFANGILGGFEFNRVNHELKSPNREGIEEDFIEIDSTLLPIELQPNLFKSSQFSLTSDDENNYILDTDVKIISSMPDGDSFTIPYDTCQTYFQDSKYNFNVTRIYDATVNDFKDLFNYGVILIDSHGTLYKDTTPMIYLEQELTLESGLANITDLVTGNLLLMNGHFVIAPSFFETTFSNNQLPNSYVHLGCCHSAETTDLTNAFLNVGAQTVTGYTDAVFASYDGNIVSTMITELLNQHTIGEAFQEAITLYGANDGDVAFADINGNNDLRIIPTGLINGSFENLLVGWRTTGDCRVIKKLSSLASTHGENMCIISTGLGSVNDSNSSINQTIKVTPNMKNLVFDYNVISEEPMEYVGSTFDDTFVVNIYNTNGTLLKQVVYESVNSSSWTAVDGIDFLGGDDTTYHTGWKTKELDLSSYVNTSITLTFWTYDKGDSIYDTATLIDNIHITN